MLYGVVVWSVEWCGASYTATLTLTSLIFLINPSHPHFTSPLPPLPPSHLLHPYKMLNCNKMNLLHVKCTRSYKYNHSRRVACIAAMRIEEEVREGRGGDGARRAV